MGVEKYAGDRGGEVEYSDSIQIHKLCWMKDVCKAERWQLWGNRTEGHIGAGVRACMEVNEVEIVVIQWCGLYIGERLGAMYGGRFT